MMLEYLIEKYPDCTFLKADGLDDAVIGVDCNSFRLVYSVKKCINIFMDMGMSYGEAVEYFDFNVGGAFVGTKTPVWCDDL